MMDIKELQDCQLEILEEIDRVCQENGLSYCLAYGTCIGAIRHKGFIPWDDDIDILMSAEDFEKFNALASSFRKPFFLQNRHTDKEYGLMISRVRNSNTTLIEKNEAFRDMNHGIFVDVYPLFDCPKGKFAAKSKIWNAMLYRLFLYGVPPKNRGKLMKVGSTVLLAVTPKKVRKSFLDKLYKKLLKPGESGFVSPYYGDSIKRSFPKEWFWPPVRVPFEGKSLPVPADYDSFLRKTYGDYMQLPPVEKQVVHHDFEYVDAHTPYTEYKGKYYCKNNSDR